MNELGVSSNMAARSFMIAQALGFVEALNQSSDSVSYSATGNDVMNATFECGDCNTTLLNPTNHSLTTDGGSSQRVVIQCTLIATLSASVAVLNTLLIATVCRSRHLRTSVSNAFILNLAVVDITLAIFVLPMFAATVVVRVPPGGPSTCGAVGFVTQTLLVESIITLAFIGVDRYVNICHPLRYLQLVNKQTVAVFISSSWIYSLLVAAAPLVGFGTYSFLGPDHLLICSVDYSIAINKPSSFQREYAVLVLGTVVAPAVIAIAVVYTRIFLAARMQTRRISDAGLPPFTSSSTTTRRSSLPSSTSGPIAAKLTSQVSPKSADDSEQKNDVIAGETSEPNPAQPGAHRGWRNVAVRMALTPADGAKTTLKGKSLSVEYDRDGKWLNVLSKVRKAVRQVRAARTVALIIGGFFLCWTPYTVITITTVVTGSQPNNYDANFTANFMAFAGGLVNPGVCLLVNREYWTSFRILVGLRRRELMRMAARAFAEAAAENTASECGQAGCRQRFMSIESVSSEISETSDWVIFRESWKKLQESASAV